MFFEVYDTDSPAGEVWLLNIYFAHIKARNTIADSSKPNKLRNVYTIRSKARNVTIHASKTEFLYQNLSHRVYHKF